ncbi:MAG: hypothetical protein EZS28_004253 [Streblomastix strix]|uniref:Uncharacterized protein n=1 Tax=Streblomastix strix TaxID=222440 RepID=A0A5J4X0T9_9EUKA|nr:MAG: hypothetical protein EZS28_004248 [Streblomastix strix]KAA6400225.1 MAG: hypothetical protein EZS28_004253 [Streblomastix strix]
MELRTACRKMNGGDQCDLNLSPVQSGRLITQLLAAMEIDKPERQNTKRYSAYLEKPRQCAHSRSPETQDRVQGRLRSTFEFIQDYLVRAGRRCYNPGPGLFRQVLESDIRDPEEERRLAQDAGLPNSEQRAPNGVFQTRRDYIYSGNNTTQRLGYNNRPASSLPSHQSSGRDATLSMLQLQWSLLQLQRNAVWSFNGPENLYQMPLTSNSRGQETMQLENLRLRRRYSDPELGSRNTVTRDIVSNDDTTGVWMDDRNGQEPDQSHADSRVLGLAVEHESNDNVNNNVSKERSLEITKASNGTSQEKETRKNKGLGIGNWRDPIHKSTIQTRRASHQVAPKAERQGSSQQRLEQVDSTQQERDTRHNLVDQQARPEPTTVLHETKQMDNSPNRCVELRMGSNFDQREPGENNTVTMYCLNKGKGSITIAPLVDKVLKLAEQYNWTIEASHIPGLSNTIPDSLSRLSRCGDYAIKREVLQKTLKDLGIQISIDIFATRANRQCTRYCSISKDKCAVKRNGFSLEWAKEVPLLHPPISQLLKTIRKIKQERVSLAVLIAPDWPNQKWFTELREITRQKICLGESTQVLLMEAKHRNKGWALPPGLIYLFFQWEQERREAFQTVVISQRTEFQCSRPSHFQLVKLMENTYSRSHIAGRIPQKDQSTA